MKILPVPMRYAVLLTLLAGLVTGCGQKGDLYLRDRPPAGVKPAPAEPYQPIPYPKPDPDKPDSGKKS